MRERQTAAKEGRLEKEYKPAEVEAVVEQEEKFVDEVVEEEQEEQPVEE